MSQNNPLDMALSTTACDNPSAVIACVHKSAGVQYRIIKQRKQTDLRPKVLEAQRSGDKDRIKTAKKKVDNHASAVACRVKQEFLTTSFENLVTALMHECARLRRLNKKSHTESLKKDALLAQVTERLQKILHEKDALQTKLMPIHGGPQVPTDSHWLQTETQDFRHVSEPHDLLADFSSQPSLLAPRDVEPVPSSSLPLFLDELRVRCPTDTKLDPAPWELYRHVHSERQASFRAQLREEESVDDAFNPVA